MRCPFCGNVDTQVKDSRPAEDNVAIRRRRFCPACGGRFTTYERVQLREQDVCDLDDVDAFDLVWLPAPFLTETALTAALPRVVAALAPGGWLVVGTNPPPGDDVGRAVARWVAALNGGSATDAPAMAGALVARGLSDVAAHPTVPGGPVLVAGRRS